MLVKLPDCQTDSMMPRHVDPETVSYIAVQYHAGRVMTSVFVGHELIVDFVDHQAATAWADEVAKLINEQCEPQAIKQIVQFDKDGKISPLPSPLARDLEAFYEPSHGQSRPVRPLRDPDAASQEINRLLTENARLTAERDKWKTYATSPLWHNSPPSRIDCAPVSLSEGSSLDVVIQPHWQTVSQEQAARNDTVAAGE